MKKKKQPTKDGKYGDVCSRCKIGYPPSRAVILNEVFWLHDIVTQCKAAKLREEDFQKSRGA